MKTTNEPKLGQENPPVNEKQAIAEIIKLTLELSDKTANPVQRQQHPKSHGCVKAEFIVEDVPEQLKFGIFKEPRRYPAFIRFSNGSTKPDPEGDVRGMAIKLLGVEGEKLLEGQQGRQTQDFILINYPVLFLKDAQDTLAFSKAIQAVKNTSAIALKPITFILKYALTHPKQFKILKAIRGQTTLNPLQLQYWSTTPYRLGSNAVKFSTKPHLVKKDLVEKGGEASPNPTSANFLREVMVKHLDQQDAQFDFLVQLQKNSKHMPLEDATIEWGENESPFIKVATIRIPMQTFDTEVRKRFDENLSYNPWHATSEHQPLGGVNRLRKQVYQAVSEMRHKYNNVSPQEPTVDDYHNLSI